MMFARGLRRLGGALALSCGAPLLVAAAGPAPDSPAAPAWESLRYQIEQVPDQRHGEALEVRLRFHNEADGETSLLFHDAWAGETGLSGAMEITHIPRRTTLSAGSEPGRWVLRGPPGARVRLTYRVWQDWEDPAPRDEARRGGVDEHRWYKAGYALWLAPDWSSDVARPIGIRCASPRTSWFSVGDCARRRPRSSSLRELWRGLYLGGDWQVHRIDADSPGLELATSGPPLPLAAVVSDALPRLMREILGIWAGQAPPSLLVALVPAQGPCCTYGGTALEGGFLVYLSPGARDVRRLQRVVAHELFHRWNGLWIERPQDLVASAWFTEGFTQFYARILMLRAGLIDLGAYTDDVNQALERAAAARARLGGAWPADYWSDARYRELLYTHGDVVAQDWNRRLLDAGVEAGLDALMREVGAEAEAGPATRERVLRALARALGSAAPPDAVAEIDPGTDPSPNPRALGPCVTLRVATLPLLDSGLDLSRSLGAGVVLGVDPEGPAARAGLVEGARLLDWDIPEQSRPEAPLRLTIETDAGRRTLSYLPLGREVQIPQYTLNEAMYADDPGACLQGLRGAPAGG